MDSTPGQGSRFFFSLDLQRLEEFGTAKLDFIEEKMPEVPGGSRFDASSWVWPPEQDLQRLRALARLGRRKALKEWADTLERRDVRYSRMTKCIRQLADNVKNREIISLIASHAQEAPAGRDHE